MLVTPDPAFDVALALAALLAISAAQAPSWDCADPATPMRSWLPWVVLVAIAVASAVFGIMHPQDFAAASGQGLPDPGLPGVVLGQL